MPYVSKESMVKLRGKPLGNAVYLAPRKGLQDVLVPTASPINEFLTGVENVIKTLSAEMEEEGRQDTVRITGTTGDRGTNKLALSDGRSGLYG
jgi:hypothetical protein